MHECYRVRAVSNVDGFFLALNLDEPLHFRSLHRLPTSFPNSFMDPEAQFHLGKPLR